MSEMERHELYVFIETLFGRHTEAFMSMLAPELPLEMARLRSELRGEMAQLRGDMRTEMAELRGEMADFRGEMRAEMADFRSEMRTEMAGMVPKLVVANILAMAAVGLVLAVLAIA